MLVGFLAYTGYNKFITGKVGAVQIYLLLVGIGYVVAGLLSSGWFLLIVGLIAVFIGFSMYANKTRGEFWRYILIVVFVVLSLIWLLTLFECDFGSAKGICSAISVACIMITNIYMLFFVLSKEVKAKFD